ncbi:fimbrial protein [Enterobacter cloacae complex sp. P6RS]|nr:fimbrial protein [Enterobacter cloacae complex sp. P4RS]MBE4994521.1 fimbrial protein [Enterobacter cloacae complex sp. P6RS]
MINRSHIFLATLAMLIAVGAHAEDNTAVITVTVTAVVEPCIINNNQTIDVDFGNDIATTDVAIGLAQRFIYYTLDCSDADPGKTLGMKISGTGSGFNTDYLQSSIPDLAIKITTDGDVTYPLNSTMPISNTGEPPSLKATLMQRPGSRLPTGEFSASATMSVNYL